MANTSRIRVVRRPADELSDAQIARLVEFGQREAALIDELQAAVRTGDRTLTWQLAEALCRLEDEVKQEPLPPAA
jgi:hypothetical protein